MATKRPLKWLIGLHEANPIAVQDKSSSLLGEGPAVLDEIVRHGAGALRLLLEKDAEPVDISIVILGARLFNNARAVSLLLRNGYIAPAILLMREMVHSLVLALFFRDHPEKADIWNKAESRKEREEFKFARIWRDVEHGEAWKEVYGYYSTMGHSNTEAKVTYGKPRQIFGYDLQLQGFYDPIPIVHLFSNTLEITLWFQAYCCDWYRQDVSIPVDFESNLDRLDAATKEFKKKLSSRAKQEDTIVGQDDSISIYEQVSALVTLRLMMEQKRRGKVSS